MNRQSKSFTYIFMPLKYTLAIGCLVTLCCISSCKKFLEMPLRDKVPQENLFSDENGFMDAMTGVYLAMDKPGAGIGMGLYTHDLSVGMLSTMVNNYPNASTSTFNNSLFANVYRYDYEAAVVKDEIRFIWGGMYNNIANLNNLLTYVDTKENVFTRDHFYRVKGEAIALRALFHFDLARLFGESPVDGMETRAIPYIRTFSVKSSPFITLGSALDSCIADLTLAKDILAKSDTTKLQEGDLDLYAGYSQNHMNFWAVKALLARVYLYKGDYANAMRYAQEVVGSNKFPLSTSNVAAATASVRDRLFSKELVFSLYNSNIIDYNGGLFNQSSGQPLQLPQANKNTIYGTTPPLDWRLSWFDNNARNINVPSKYFQDANLPYVMQNIVPLIRVSEMYYILAECANNLGEIEVGLHYLNEVRKARGLNALDLSTVPDKIALSIEIDKEYKKEFIQEGQAFFYYKRLKKDLKMETGTTAVVPENVYVFPVPDKENEYNPN